LPGVSKSNYGQVEVASWLTDRASCFNALPEINCYTKLFACLWYMQSVFDSLFVNQVKSTPSSSNDFDKENIRLKCRLINPHYFTNLERNSV
jgi:hypothetical protein